MSLKNKAMAIVVFMISVLLLISLYSIIKYNQGEIKHITRVHDDLSHKFFDIAMTHLPTFYANGMKRLLGMERLQKALAEKDEKTIGQLTTAFYNSFKQRTPHLQEINYYFNESGTQFRAYVSKAPGYRPVSVHPMLTGANKIQIPYNGFIIEKNGINYRLLRPVLLGKKTIAALEFVVAPTHFTESIEDMLELKSTIIVKTDGQLKEAVNSNGEIFPNILNTLGEMKTDKEISFKDKTYILHKAINIPESTGKTGAKLLLIQDITPIKKKINRSIFQVVAVSIVILSLIFVILYYSFGKLMDRIIERDKRLQVMNEEMEQEISERKTVQEELIIHRDHLEELIAEGTRELEIKNQEVEASEKKFRTITSSIRDAVIMIDEQGRVSFWNESAVRIFGYSPNAVQGEELFRLIVPQSHKQENVDAFEIFKKADAEKAVDEIIEVEARRKNGEIFPIEITPAVVDIQGQLNTVAVIRDITRRKAAERERRVLSSAVEQSSVVIVITDTDGTVEYVNPKFTEVTGHAREEALGKNPNILSAGMHTTEFYKELWDTITSGSDWRGEFYNKKKNGELYWEASQISPIKDAAGQITHFVAFKEDITERKRMESELLSAKESAEAASHSKSDFLANMSHELRTPMNAIIGMTELVLETRITREQREYLHMVQQSSDSLLSLLNDILDLSRIEAGRLALEPVRFNLRQSMGEIARTQGPQAHKKNLELVYYIDSELPDHLVGDIGRLRQIIVNLIDNSIKFTDKGEIILKIEALEELSEDKVKLHFLVSDTGIGIPEKKLETIFEKFSQADTSITRKYGGSGLGLAITTSLVGLMQGMIWADSPATFPHFNKSGPGSTLHFTAAFDIDKTTPEAKKAINIGKLKGLPLLIVDDNKTNRRFLQEVLNKYGLEPGEADSGKEALRLLKEKSFQLLILDYQMPEMDGGTVLEKLRSEMGSDIPVILISSGIKGEELERFKRLGISAHFFKPINTRELLESIARALGYEVEEQEETTPAGENRELRKDKKGVHILVAEDNLINQRLIKRLLEKGGHTVDMANDGKEAVEKFRQQEENPYRMIFMDIQMPVMDGVQATREIRKNHGDIPIIALTAYAMKGDKNKFLSEGMNDYISKPIKRSLLFELVDKYILEE